MRFFTETMFNFNRMIGDYLKNDLGCKQLVNAGNWRTADNVTMLDAERWSYAANDVMAVNRYYGGAHEGKNNGWAIVNGDRFTDESVLLRPRELPLTLKQVDGFPMLITESSWVPPLRLSVRRSLPRCGLPILVPALTVLLVCDGRGRLASARFSQWVHAFGRQMGLRHADVDGPVAGGGAHLPARIHQAR